MPGEVVPDRALLGVPVRMAFPVVRSRLMGKRMTFLLVQPEPGEVVVLATGDPMDDMQRAMEALVAFYKRNPRKVACVTSDEPAGGE